MNQSIKSSYQKYGYYYPLNALEESQALDYAERLTRLSESEQASSLGYRGQLNNLHVICPFVNDIMRNNIILDAVETLLDSNLMVWAASLFLKPPRSQGHVSWHQDLTYWGLNNDQQVAAWIALGPVTRANGCMRFVPSSHKLGQIDHNDTVNETNILTRGQHADIEIDESKTDYVELKPGQVSLHHGHLLHASGPNNTDQARLGLSINYISTTVRQSVAKTDYAMLVRGEDRYNHFQHIPEPNGELDEQAMNWHRRIVGTHNETLYRGADNMDSAPKLE